MIKSKREIEATIGILSESSMENPFLILIINTCEKHSHHNIGRSFIKILMSGGSSDNEWKRVVQQVTTNDNDVTTSDNKRLVQPKKTNKSKWKKVILGFKMKQKANLVPEGFCSIFNQFITIIYSAI